MRVSTLLAVAFVVIILGFAYSEVLVENRDFRIRNGGLILDSSVVKSAFVPSTSGLDLGSSSARWKVYASDINCSNCIALGSETTGNYIAGISAGTGISVSNGSGEGVAAAVSLDTSYTDNRYVNTSGDAMTGTLTVPTLVATNLRITSQTGCSTLSTDSSGNVTCGSGTVTGSGTTNKIPKWTGDSTLGDSTITDNGSTITLGRNTTIQGNLTVSGKGNFIGTEQVIKISDNGGGGVPRIYIEMTKSGGGAPGIQLKNVDTDTTSSVAWIARDNTIVTWEYPYGTGKAKLDTSGRLYVNTIRDYSGGDLILQDDAGKVGIGTTAPSYKLDVSGDIRATGQIIAGDLVFKNNFRIVEDGDDALLLLNPNGAPIMRIDINGNIWIKGDIRRGVK